MEIIFEKQNIKEVDNVKVRTFNVEKITHQDGRKTMKVTLYKTIMTRIIIYAINLRFKCIVEQNMPRRKERYIYR